MNEQKRIVVSPATAEKIETLLQEVETKDPEVAERIKSKWKIYSDPVIEDNKGLLAKAGETVISTGYIYAPYVPLQTSPGVTKAPKAPLEEFVEEVFKEEIEEGKIAPIIREISAVAGIDLNEFALRKGLRTKYNTLVVNPNYFGTVKVENL